MCFSYLGIFYIFEVRIKNLKSDCVVRYGMSVFGRIISEYCHMLRENYYLPDRQTLVLKCLKNHNLPGLVRFS